MQYPFKKYRLGTRFGVRGGLWRSGYHTGLDLVSAGYGGDGLVRPLYAGRVARISRESSGGSYGNCVYVRHADGYLTLYAHLKTIYVKTGMPVNEDTVLGVEGSTGNVTGRHLHLEVHKGEYRYPGNIDPLEFIEARLGQEEGGEEMTKQIRIRLNGVEKQVVAIEKDGHNYVMLQDLRDDKISVGYDAAAKLPEIWVRDK